MVKLFKYRQVKDDKYQKSAENHDDRNKTLKKLKDTLKSTATIKGYNFLKFYLCCLSRKRADFKYKMDKATLKVHREMDLKKFIERQRLIKNSLFGLLRG